jgi:hypothetical protein
MVALIVICFVGLFGLVVGCGALASAASYAAGVEGQRAALKAAIEMTRERADVSLYMAPEAELSLGLIRARAVHDIEMELRKLLAEVR